MAQKEIRQLTFIEANRLKEELDKINTFLDGLYYMNLNGSVTDKEFMEVGVSLTRVDERITKQLKEFYEHARKQ